MKMRNLKGFTMLEVLIYVSILTVIIVVVGSFFLWIIHSNTKAKAMRETLYNSRRAMEVMTYEIKETDSIYAQTSEFDSDFGQLSLKTTKYLPSGEETSYIDFFLCGTRLCVKKESLFPIALTSDQVEVKKLRFTKVITGTNPSVQIDLKIDYKNPNNKQEYQSSIETTSTASIRNY